MKKKERLIKTSKNNMNNKNNQKKNKNKKDNYKINRNKDQILKLDYKLIQNFHNQIPI